MPESPVASFVLPLPVEELALVEPSSFEPQAAVLPSAARTATAAPYLWRVERLRLRIVEVPSGGRSRRESVSRVSRREFVHITDPDCCFAIPSAEYRHGRAQATVTLTLC